MIPDEQRDSLRDYLAKAFGEPCEITGIARLSVGQSRAMHVVDLACSGGPRKVVVRVEQWGLLGTKSRDEVAAMRALHAAGQPVAEILAFEPSDDVLGQPFFVMEYVPGTSAYQPESLDPFVDALAGIHALDPAALAIEGYPVPASPRDPALMQVERWYDIYRGALLGEPSPLIEEAAQWLRNNAPETERVSLVHGDPGPGNYLHENGALRALVDWEFAHLGDADEDWAYLICMRGLAVMRREEWLTYLADRLDVRISAERLDYWIAFNLFKGACIDQTALDIYARRELLAPNLLAIGTCVHLSALKRLANAVL